MQGGLCAGGVSVQGESLCAGGSLCVQEESLCAGVSVQGGLCRETSQESEKASGMHPTGMLSCEQMKASE